MSEIDCDQPNVSKNAPAEEPDFFSNVKSLRLATIFLGATTIAFLVSTIMLAVDEDTSVEVLTGPTATSPAGSSDPAVVGVDEPNPCAGKRPDLPNVPCQDVDEAYLTGEQAGANVTAGYNGSRNTTAVPITTPYREAGLCPVNVHWHIGAEHYSMGEYDENGSGPIDFHEGRQGFQCSYYNENDPAFNAPQYPWKHCIGMTVGQTYEVHWPHSAAGLCNSIWQYQTPFYDGVFCKDKVLVDTAQQIGVQSQTFTIVADEAYYYPDLFSGMIVDESKGMGVDLAIYTGSTTGTQRNNEVCSQFSPITWQVDRKCHLISASSFDKMCGEMKQQADNLADDLYAHGSRELVADEHAANNHQTRRLIELSNMVNEKANAKKARFDFI